MATNFKYNGDRVTLTESNVVAENTPTNSGDAVREGNIVGVAIADGDTTNDEVVVALTGVWELSVTGANDVGNTAISAGDKLYLDGADGSAVVNADSANGTFFGIALEAVASGATTAIDVLLGHSS